MTKPIRLKLLLFLLCAQQLSAQQDPMFTKYVFNSLIFNPAYAGSKGYISTTAIYRQQWAGFEGSPVTQSITAHSPLRNERANVGMSLFNDQAGAVGTTNLSLSYAYRVPLGGEWKLAAGLQAGVGNWRGNWRKLTLEDQNDIAFQNNLNRWLPNFGAGLYLSSPLFYAGLGCPSILEYNLRKANTAEAPIFSKNYRHYYTTAGAAIPLAGESLVFRPSILLKSTAWFSQFRSDAQLQNIGSPTEIDIDLSVFFLEKFWLGAALRSALNLRNSSYDSADLWFCWYLDNGLRLGAAYDFPLSNIRQSTAGSFELLVGYDFDIKVKNVATPRYF
jgi:type IX secretion system PorP/SprF family membrane protein